MSTASELTLPSPAAAVINTAGAPAADLSSTWTGHAGAAVRWGVITTVLAVGSFFAWTTLAPLAGSVVAMGLVKVDTNRKTVQHRDGGTVQRILVREGEAVRAGQLLVELADTRVDATLDQASAQLDAMRLRQLRLTAEREFSPVWRLPEAWRKRLTEPRVAEVVAREQSLFSTRRSALDAQMRQMRGQIDEVAREIAAREREAESVRMALQHMQEEVQVNEALLEQQFVNKTRVLGLKRAAAEYQMKAGENAAELSRAKRSATDLELRISTLRDGYAQEASTELRDVSNKVVELEEQLRTASDASSRQQIVAPVAGRVVDLRVTTAGGSIGPRDPIMDIVPDESPRLVEARVAVDAVGELRNGLHADVRLTPYRQRDMPLVDGKLIYVSADSLTDRQTGAPYFVIHIELDRASLERAGNPVVSPGMGAEVFVRTRERSALDYLLEPLVNATRRSFRDH